MQTQVPMKLGSWVIDCSRNETVHLGEREALQNILQASWVGPFGRKCEVVVPQVLLFPVLWALVYLPYPSTAGQRWSFDNQLGSLPKTKHGNEFCYGPRFFGPAI